MLFMFRVRHAFVTFHCSLKVTCCDMTGLLALLYMLCFIVFCHFPSGVLGQVWYLNVSIPEVSPPYLLWKCHTHTPKTNPLRKK